jgi:hypothetical protein
LSRPRADESVEAIAGRLAPIIRKKIDYGEALRLSRANLAIRIIDAVEEACQRGGVELSDADGRNVVTILTNLILSEAKRFLQGGNPAAGAGAGTSDWSRRPSSGSNRSCWTGSTSARRSPCRRTNWPSRSAKS